MAAVSESISVMRLVQRLRSVLFIVFDKPQGFNSEAAAAARVLMLVPCCYALCTALRGNIFCLIVQCEPSVLGLLVTPKRVSITSLGILRHIRFATPSSLFKAGTCKPFCRLVNFSTADDTADQDYCLSASICCSLELKTFFL